MCLFEVGEGNLTDRKLIHIYIIMFLPACRQPHLQLRIFPREWGLANDTAHAGCIEDLRIKYLPFQHLGTMRKRMMERTKSVNAAESLAMVLGPGYLWLRLEGSRMSLWMREMPGSCHTKQNNSAAKIRRARACGWNIHVVSAFSTTDPRWEDP